MTITGGTQAVNVVLSILRMKALALLVGPAGVGILSIYNNLQATGAAIAGLGLGSSGVRQIAQSKGHLQELARVRRVLVAANVLQGALAMGVVWFLRDQIAALLFDEPGYETAVGFVGVAILLNLMSTSQTALLRGMRRIGDLGRVTVLGALAGTAVGIAAVWTWGTDGLVWLVLAQPFTAVMVAAFFTRRLPNAPDPVKVPPGEIWRIWKPMVQLGAGFMIGGLASSAILLFVRGKIANDLGLDAAGQFAAAWAITMTYVGFLLTAMSMDYYPRLAELIHNRTAAVRLMNDQLQIGLAVGGPILLFLIGAAPFLVRILYSDQFDMAIALVQWQTVGNIFKLTSWSLSMSIVASARSKTHLIMEASFLVPFLALIYVFLPSWGLEIAGIAFMACYLIYLLVAWAFARKIVDFRFEPLSLAMLLATTVSGGVLLLLSFYDPLVGAGAATAFAAVTGFVGGHILLEKIGPSRYTAPLARIYAFCRWPISEH